MFAGPLHRRLASHFELVNLVKVNNALFLPISKVDKIFRSAGSWYIIKIVRHFVNAIKDSRRRWKQVQLLLVIRYGRCQLWKQGRLIISLLGTLKVYDLLV